MSDPYDDLSEGVRRWVDDRGWKTWNLIQAQAMPEILAGRDALLVAPTASGKTEAALLPLVSRILTAKAQPVALLYVAPLRALINDQTERAYLLLTENGLRAEWWHGDLSSGKRKAILRRPPHALFTTPESLDVMLSSATYGYGNLLGEVRFVLIDEIHAFADSDRGAQLLSVLARLQALQSTRLQRVALSATIGDPEAVARWMQGAGATAPVKVIVDPSTRSRRLAVGLVPEVKDPALTKADRAQADQIKLAETIVRHVKGKRAIVFTISRAEAERLTLELRGRGIETYIHHGSVDRLGRRATEKAFKIEGPSTIVATSTLELGIDIGELEIVVQVGATATANSLLQRVGRSGRRKDTDSVGVVYATRLEQLPEALAAADLALNGTVESLRPSSAALQVMFQQVIQLVRERDGVLRAEGLAILGQAGCFQTVTQREYDDLIDELAAAHFLDIDSTNKLRIGLEAERKLGYANYRDFYALFQSDDGWTVRSGSQTIGSLDRNYPIATNREVIFILAGRRWRVIRIDRERHLLEVEIATSGAIPNWHSPGAGGSFELMRRTIALLDGTRTTPLEKPALIPYMTKLRAGISAIGVSSTSFGLRLAKGGTEIWTFAGSELNSYLATLLVAALPDNGSVQPTATHLSAACDVTTGAQLIERILADEAYRSELEADALDLIASAEIGKYWQFFGPKTKRNVQARTLHAQGALLEHMPEQRIVTTGAPAVLEPPALPADEKRAANQ